MSNSHKVGDLVLRYYFTTPILGQVISINEELLYMYQIEWVNPENESTRFSSYARIHMRDGKDRLNEYLRT
jgi:hypothetical protein